MWQSYIKHFKNYLRLERSFSDNSVQAYVRDVEKLAEYLELANLSLSPKDLEEPHISGFLKYIAELGLGPIRLYGSYSPKSMYEHDLDMRPFTLGFRLSNW